MKPLDDSAAQLSTLDGPIQPCAEEALSHLRGALMLLEVDDLEVRCEINLHEDNSRAGCGPRYFLASTPHDRRSATVWCGSSSGCLCGASAVHTAPLK